MDAWPLALITMGVLLFVGWLITDYYRDPDPRPQYPHGVNTMRLRFIGTDGSMGLTRGQVYEAAVYGPVFGPYQVQMIEPIVCPYTSWGTLWKNWELVDDVISPSRLEFPS